MSDFLIHVGNRVRTLRKLKGLTQEKLGERAGLPYTYIGGIERGERNIALETLEKVIKGLDVDVVELFSLESALNDSNSKKEYLIDGYKALLLNRSEEEIKMVHKVVKDILTLLDSKEE